MINEKKKPLFYHSKDQVQGITNSLLLCNAHRNRHDGIQSNHPIEKGRYKWVKREGGREGEKEREGRKEEERQTKNGEITLQKKHDYPSKPCLFLLSISPFSHTNIQQCHNAPFCMHNGILNSLPIVFVVCEKKETK